MYTDPRNFLESCPSRNSTRKPSTTKEMDPLTDTASPVNKYCLTRRRKEGKERLRTRWALQHPPTWPAKEGGEMRIEAELPFVTTSTLPQHKPTAQPWDAEQTVRRQNQASILPFSLKHSLSTWFLSYLQPPLANQLFLPYSWHNRFRTHKI